MSLSNYEYWIQEHDGEESHTVAKIRAKNIIDAEVCMYEVLREYLINNTEEEFIGFYTILQIPKSAIKDNEHGQN